METPNREAQGYSRNIVGIYLPGSSYSLCIPDYVLGVPSLGFRVSGLGSDSLGAQLGYNQGLISSRRVVTWSLSTGPLERDP